MKEYDLVVLFADADAENLVQALIQRGIERKCLKPIHWRCIRDPMCDASVAQNPTEAVMPYLKCVQTRFLILWDHHGSGCESKKPEDMETEVQNKFVRRGIAATRVSAICFVPELESTLVPVWDRVKAILANQRGELPYAASIDPADPRKSLLDTLEMHNLRASSAHFQTFGTQISLPEFKKGDALARVSAVLTSWFGETTWEH